MRVHSEPIIGTWYNSNNFPESFVVIDADKDDYVEIQYLDGVLDKIDFDTWYILNPEEVAEPEDETAPYAVDHEEDVRKILNELDEDSDLEQNLRHIDRDESEWE